MIDFPFKINDLLVLTLTFLGSFIGVNFGGSMLFVLPTLLGMGYSPVTILASTRPAIISQSFIGLRMFRKYNDLTLKEQLALIGFSSLGALVGIYFIANLDKKEAMVIMLIFIILLSIIASLKQILLKVFKRDDRYLSVIKRKSILLYSITGFFPAIIGGMIGSGAGLIVVLFSFMLLNKNIYNSSFLEKNVSLGHSVTVLIWFFFYGSFDIKMSLIVFIGTVVGAYYGAKITLKLNVVWMYAVIISLSLVILIKNIL